ncbi:MAG: hypothetical protein NTX87_07040 [Planctomycetota bacterium]|nr:hypothetical protein [Planctomycetota bacterium]
MAAAARAAMLILLCAAASAVAQATAPPGKARAPAAPGERGSRAPRGTAPAQAPKAEEGGVTFEAPAEQVDRLRAEALKGRLSDALLAQFKDLAAAVAQGRLKDAGVSEELWTWVAANKDLRDPLLLALFPRFEPGVFRSLEALKAKFGDQVVTYHHLALAFALVYGRAAGKPVRGPEVGFTEKGRKVPSMEDSFGWYLKNERAMKMPLKTTPWPLLVFVADNDLPLDERAWALARYGNSAPATFGKIYYDVSYNDTLIKETGESSHVWTLATILNNGGICMHQAYFASRVLKCFGVPALFDRGQGERGGHAWAAWVGREGQSVGLLYSGRFDYDRYYTGEVFNPVERHMMLDRDVELDAVAMGRSYPGYLDAVAASHICSMFEGQDCQKVVGILEGAVLRNPYCDLPWRLTAYWVAQGYIPQVQGEKMYDGMLKTFAAYPDLTFEVLHRILQPRLKPATQPADAEIARNLQLLDRAFGVYESAKRPDLAVRLRALQGQYLEAVGRRDDALKLYAMASEKYAADHYGFLMLYDRAVAIMKEDRKPDMLLKYMGIMAARVPEYQADFNRKYDLKNPAWCVVVKTYADTLRAAGKSAEAQNWEAKLPKKKT